MNETAKNILSFIGVLICILYFFKDCSCSNDSSYEEKTETREEVTYKQCFRCKKTVKSTELKEVETSPGYICTCCEECRSEIRRKKDIMATLIGIIKIK